MNQATEPDKASLLRELRIERTEPEPAPVSQRSPMRRIAGWAVLAALPVAWLVFDRMSGMEAERAGPQTAATITMAEPSQTSVENLGTHSLLDAAGYIVARRRATVSAQVTGKVVEVLIEEGKYVEAGEVIARLEDSTYRAAVAQAKAHVAQAEAALDAARIAFEDAKPIYRRNERQHDVGMISAQAFDTARAAYNKVKAGLTVAQRDVDAVRAGLTIARRNLEDTIVRAPFAGVVTEKAAQPGEIVSPMSAGGGFTRTGIGTIVDMSSLEVEVDVNETFIDRVYADQAVIVKLNAYADGEIPGAVIASIPTADRAKATVRVRIELLKEDPRVIPEMGVRVSFLDEPGRAEPRRYTRAQDAARRARKEMDDRSGFAVSSKRVGESSQRGAKFVSTSGAPSSIPR